MFKNFKVVNIFKYFGRENRKRLEANTHDKEIYISIASSLTLLGVLMVPTLLLNGKLDDFAKSSSIYLSGGVVFCLMYFVFKK